MSNTRRLLRLTMQLPRVMVTSLVRAPVLGYSSHSMRSAVRIRRLSCIAIVGSAASAAKLGTEPRSLVRLGLGSALRGGF